MQRVMGNAEPSAVSIFRDLRNRKYARVARNVVEVANEDGEGTHWEWDETVFPVSQSATTEYVESNKETLEFEASRAQMSDADWRKDMDASALDLSEMVTETYAGMLDVMEMVTDILGGEV